MLLPHPLRALVALILFSSASRADVEFTSPGASSTMGATEISIEWRDSKRAPLLKDLTTYTLTLCTGSDDAIYPLDPPIVPNGAFTSGSSISGTVPLNIGGNAKNAYFLKMLSTAATGGTITNYSPRFTLTGMTGAFPAAVIESLKKVKSTSGPPSVNAVVAAPAPGKPAAGENAAQYEVLYTAQTGPIRYAPMAPRPGAQITVDKVSRQWETSAFEIYTTNVAPATVQTTVTQSATWVMTSRANPAAPASMPTGDMEKFLKRWED